MVDKILKFVKDNKVVSGVVVLILTMGVLSFFGVLPAPTL
jgi:hypothetical protein